MDIKELPIKEVKHTHSGQYHAYGDSFYEWEIHIDKDTVVDRENLLAYCFDKLSQRKVQSKAEWSANYSNADSYFSGYYELIKADYGFKFIVCSPYTD